MTGHKAVVVVLSLAVVATSSCGRGGGEDARRIDLLLDDPVLDVEPAGAVLLGDWENPNGPGPQFFGESGSNRVGRRFDVNDPRAFMIEVTAAAIEAGWTIGDDDFSVVCRPEDRYFVRGHRVEDGLTAFVEIDTYAFDGETAGMRGAITLEMASGEAAEGLAEGAAGAHRGTTSPAPASATSR